MKIGSVDLSSPLVLAPMAGVTNHAFRVMVKRLGGCGLVCTEMFSGYAIKYKDPKTKNMIDWTEEERPVSVQVFAGDPETVAIGAKYLQDAGADIVDINFGCPVPKVVKSGSGAAVLKDPDVAREIMIAARAAVDIPLTVKTRIGWHIGEVAVLDIAKKAEICGIDAIAVHGRYAQQGYSGTADWDIIAQVKESVRIPVIANGDVRSCDDAEKVVAKTGCDGIMIGRGALGDPWVFARIARFLETGEKLPEPDARVRLDGAKEHARLLAELIGGEHAAREMRGHIVHYIKGLHGAAKFRDRLMQTKGIAEVYEVIDEARCKCESRLEKEG